MFPLPLPPYACIDSTTCSLTHPLTTSTSYLPTYLPTNQPTNQPANQLTPPIPQDWLTTLTHALTRQHSGKAHPFHGDPYSLRSIAVQSYDVWGSNPSTSRVGFLKLRADVSNSGGESLPGGVFLRGSSVAMLVMLIPDDVPVPGGAGGGRNDGDGDDAAYYYDERYVVLTVQPRVAAGSLDFVELPAGMVDDGDGDGDGPGRFAGTAAREIEEELGMVIPASELKCLSDMAAAPPSSSITSNATSTASAQGDQQEPTFITPVGGNTNSSSAGIADPPLPNAMYPSPGGCDEYIPIYMHEKRVPRDTLKEWMGKHTGLRDEGEKITLKLVRMRDLWREGARDAKCLAAVALWEGLKREGRLGTYC